MKIIKSFFWILLIQCALLQNFVLAEQKDTNLFCNVGKDKILFATQWDVGLNNPLKVIVKERFDKKEKINIRELAIYQQVGNSFKKMYGFETPDYSVSISQTQDSGGQLLATWTGGSAYHIYVYSFSLNNIVQVLQAGARMMPELVHLASGTEAFIITGGGTKSDESEIYCWQNNKYMMLKKLPFKKRFEKVCEK